MQPSFRILAAVAVAAVSLALITAAPSGASSSIPVSGGVVPTSSTFTSARDEGGNQLITATGTHAWSGSLVGTSVVDTHFVIHPNGQETYQGVVTFTGATPCGTGTVTFEAEGSGPFPGPALGHVTAIDAADSTVTMHADLNSVLFLGPSGASLTYSGNVTCG